MSPSAPQLSLARALRGHCALKHEACATWYGDQLVQLCLQSSDLLAQLNIVHPAGAQWSSMLALCTLHSPVGQKWNKESLIAIDFQLNEANPRLTEEC